MPVLSMGFFASLSGDRVFVITFLKKKKSWHFEILGQIWDGKDEGLGQISESILICLWRMRSWAPPNPPVGHIFWYDNIYHPISSTTFGVSWSMQILPKPISPLSISIHDWMYSSFRDDMRYNLKNLQATLTPPKISFQDLILRILLLFLMFSAH